MENKVVFGNLPESLAYEVKEGEAVRLLLATIGEEKSSHIDLKIAQNASVELAFASFGHGDSKIEITASLSKGARFNAHVASISSGGSHKEIYVSAIHEQSFSNALCQSYGIVAEKSSLVLSGTGHIKHGAKKSKTRQEARIIVFDKGCKANASPILKIDENDVDASHASAEGRISEDHLFYLLSRGISEHDARKLIVYGYLSPVLEYFQMKEKELLSAEIERSVK